MKTHGMEIGPTEYRLMGLEWGYGERYDTELVIAELVPTNRSRGLLRLELPIEAAKSLTIGDTFSVAVSS